MKTPLTLALLCVLISGTSTAAEPKKTEPSNLIRLQYNNPGLVTDLGVGLWAYPLPMDYDGDGDLDLVVSCSDKPYNGTYFFENTSGKNIKFPVFKKPVRIDNGIAYIQVSYINGKPRVLVPGIEFTDFTQNALKTPKEIIPKQTIYPILTDAKPSLTQKELNSISFKKNASRIANIRANQWKYCDYNGDGILDISIGIGDWNDYGMEWTKSGWENAYDKDGRWTRGPLHGYVYILINKGTNETPDYSKPEKIKLSDGTPLEVFGMPSPNFADFDNDGDLDILCGEFRDTLTYFENTGTSTHPVYAKGRRLMLGDKPLKLDLNMIVPVVIDWDGDGDLDIVCGQEDGRVALIENLGSFKNGAPLFNAPVFFEQEAGDLKFGALATPVSFDWDNDGDEDLIAGNSAGYIAFIENLGMNNGTPIWAKPVYIEAGDEIIRIQAGYNGIVQGTSESKWGYTTLSVADWNEDGLPDLVVNSSWGKVVWFQNIGKPGKPFLLPEKEVQVQWQGPAPKPAWTWWEPNPKALATQWRTTPFVIDLDKDGLCDLVMLDPEGYLAFYKKQMVGTTPVLLPPQRIFHVTENSITNRGHQTLDASPGLLRLSGDRAGSSGRRKLTMIDWDNDGDLDLIVNSIPNANYLENISQKDGAITFANRGPFDPLVLAGHTTSPTTVQWKKGSPRELLIGAEDGCFYYLPKKTTP